MPNNSESTKERQMIFIAKSNIVINNTYNQLLRFVIYKSKLFHSNMEKEQTNQQQTHPESLSQSHKTEHNHQCCQQQVNKPSVVVQPRPQQQKVKLQTSVLGVEPFQVSQEDEEANFISCRIGQIAQNAIKSTNLKSLLLRNNLITTIKGLDQLPNLVELELYDNKIVKIEGLDSLLQLQLLDLSYNNIKKIENISHLKKLKKLFLLSNKIKKIQNLDFPVLEMLELGSNKIKQIQNLQGVKNIRSLFLGKNRISQIKNLQHLVNLEQIALGPNKLTEINEGLVPLKSTLKQLYLQQNQITKMQNINQLEKLQILDISYNSVEHLENIDKLVNLQCLYLNANKITQYQELLMLKHNSKLSTISLFGNDVTKQPGYRMKLVQLLPQIDDIDGTPMKTSYKIIFGSSKSVASQQ